MKKLIIATIIAGTSFVLGTQTAEAGGCQTYRPVSTVTYCAPKVYKTKIIEVNRCRYQKMAYDNCGRQYCYWVTVVTFKDIYSNGQTRVWKRTYTA